MSKGSNRRPTLVSTQEADANWERIFGKKKKTESKNDCKNCENCACKSKSGSSQPAEFITSA